MPAPSKLIAELHSLRAAFDDVSLRKKENIIQELSLVKITKSKDLLELSETLLFLMAYPHHKLFLKKLTLLLEKTRTRTKTMIRKTKRAGSLENTGLTGTHVKACFSFELIEWLLHKYPNSLTLDSFGSDPELVFTLISPLLPASLREHFNEGGYETVEQWLTFTVSKNRYEQLLFISRLFTDAALPMHIRNQHFDQLEMYVDVDLNSVPGRLDIRGTQRPLYFHKSSIIRKIDLPQLLNEPLPAPVVLNEKEKQHLITAMRLQLLTLYRETDPATYADENDLHVYDAGRGMDIVLIGMDADHRQPIDSYIGFMAFKNRLPYAYGGAWLLGKMAKIGINVFPSYRGGESAWFFAQLMRVYKQVFQPAYFVAEPYQVGRNNPEGIETGAFWFYYRLGFRPVQRKLQDLAKKEFERLLQNKNHKTSKRILEQLVEDEMVLLINSDSGILKFKYDTASLSAALTKYIRQRYKGDTRAAEQEAVSTLCADLHISDDATYAALKPGLEKIALYIQAGGGIKKWNESDRQLLLNMIAEKAIGRDSEYAILYAKHEKLEQLLCKLV
ncbi:MAG: hypothetical protein IPN36_01905 [Bacteroidetes bacterium]|nr:hypothetical protein [Bacteroidota bacterium]